VCRDGRPQFEKGQMRTSQMAPGFSSLQLEPRALGCRPEHHEAVHPELVCGVGPIRPHSCVGELLIEISF